MIVIKDAELAINLDLLLLPKMTLRTSHDKTIPLVATTSTLKAKKPMLPKHLSSLTHYPRIQQTTML